MIIRRPASSAARSARRLRSVTRSSEWSSVPSRSTASARALISTRLDRLVDTERRHLGGTVVDGVGEKDQVAELPGTIAHVVAKQRFTTEAERLKHGDGRSLVGDDLDDDLAQSQAEGVEQSATCELPAEEIGRASGRETV